MKKILIIGAVPPPFHGTSLAIKVLLDSKFNNFIKIHLDISDQRDDLDNLGRFDWQNVSLGIKNLLQLIFLCLKHNPQIVYLCPSQNLAYLRDGLFIFLARLFTNAAIVQHLHGSDFLNFFNRSNFLLKLFIDGTQRLVDYTIVLGNSLKHIYRRWHPPERIYAIPNGINISVPEKMYNTNGDLPVLFFLGNLLKFKGIHTAVQAMGMVKNKYPDIRMKIAGKWADDPVFNETQEEIKKQIEEIVKAENLSANIEFLGPVNNPEKIELLQNSDIFVFPSMNEGLPLVLLEAMAAGNPVIAVDGVGAIPDVVEHNKTGILVKEQDPAAIAKAIIRLIENPELRVQMGKEARKRYLENYTEEKHIEQMDKLFRMILAGA